MTTESPQETPGIVIGNSPDNGPEKNVFEYNRNGSQTPGELKVRWQVRVERGQRAEHWNNRQAEAIREFLMWAQTYQQQERQQRSSAAPAPHALPGLFSPGEPVGVAMLARTSTLALQDPLASLQRQMRTTKAWLPEGWYITGYYWDVESGGIDVENRSQGEAWREFAAAGIPRDGGVADLLAEAASPSPSFSIVICENIERSARDTYNALKIERELQDQGVILFAADEPFDIKGISPTAILVRRVKQGVAEWFRLNLRNQTWEGLVQHAIDGYHVGPAPYGLAAQRVPHPIASKAAQGRTKTRLILGDPATVTTVQQIFTWRVLDHLSVRGISARLNTSPTLYPPHRDAGWTEAHVDKILRNPKYTGHMVYGRTRGRTHGHQRNASRDEWIWSPQPTHPAIIDLDVWEQAQLIGTHNATSRDSDSPPQGQRTYVLRSRVRCQICSRRMAGNARIKPASPRHPNGTTYIYYLCPHDKTNPRHHAAYPDHPSISIREDTLVNAITQFFRERLFGPGRAAMLAAQIPAAQASKTRQLTQQAARLTTQLQRIDKAEASLLAELEDTDTTTSPAVQKYRASLRARFVAHEEDRARLNDQLATITAQQNQATASDPALLDELPTSAGLLDYTHTPSPILAALIDATDIQCLYSKADHQATIRAVLTDATPQTIAQIINDNQPDTPVSHLPYGPIYTVAGDGTVNGHGIAGFSGDGGPATSAELYDPEEVAVDGAGNLVIADSGNNRIREVTG
jgi:hypothetical protein